MGILKLNREMVQAMRSIRKPLLAVYEDGNTQVALYKDGTKVVQSNDEQFNFDFATNIDIKITNYCKNACPFCFEGSSEYGVHGNLNHPILDTLHPWQEIAIGGGNPLDHPDLDDFLERMKAKHVIVNMTVHQRDFEQNYDRVKEMTDKGLIHGLGISLENPTSDFFAKVRTIPTAIIHTIAGLLTMETMDKMADQDLKLLILGYKNLRRGESYKNVYNQRIQENIDKLAEKINSYTDSFSLMSFDNLAISQLGMQDKCTEEEWSKFYMGDDGTQTFYIDLVKEEFAKNSTSTKRMKIERGMTAEQSFQTVKSGVA